MLNVEVVEIWFSLWDLSHGDLRGVTETKNSSLMKDSEANDLL